jgi:hypothetical protein
MANLKRHTTDEVHISDRVVRTKKHGWIEVNWSLFWFVVGLIGIQFALALVTGDLWLAVVGLIFNLVGTVVGYFAFVKHEDRDTA